MSEKRTVPPETAEVLLTKRQVAAFVQLRPRTIDEWMARGRLPYFKIGRTVRFRLADVKAHLEARYLMLERGRLGPVVEGDQNGGSHAGAEP